jgi:hypothetical protein
MRWGQLRSFRCRRRPCCPAMQRRRCNGGGDGGGGEGWGGGYGDEGVFVPKTGRRQHRLEPRYNHT